MNAPLTSPLTPHPSITVTYTQLHNACIACPEMAPQLLSSITHIDETHCFLLEALAAYIQPPALTATPAAGSPESPRHGCTGF
jgi:hypothetical protein